MKSITSHIFAIRRHRIEIDGPGVRTLVGFYGCPLSCAYCINPQCKDIKKSSPWTPMGLFEYVKIDDLYFKATKGGITFGGGEPGCNNEFIREFRRICDPQWSIALETSLNYSDDVFDSLIECIDYYIIDIKDMSNEIYLHYTGRDNGQVVRNLKKLADKECQNKCKIKIPSIPNYNMPIDIDRSLKTIKEMGYSNIELFDYMVRAYD